MTLRSERAPGARMPHLEAGREVPVRRVTPKQNSWAAHLPPGDTASGSTPVSRVAGGWHFPLGGPLEQVTSRPAGFAGVFVQVLLDSEPIPVRILGTCRAISAVGPREFRIQQGGVGS